MLGAIDTIIPEEAGESYTAFPRTAAAIRTFLVESLDALEAIDPSARIDARREKFFAMGKCTRAHVRTAYLLPWPSQNV